MQLDLVRDAIFCIKHAEMVYLRCHARVIQQEDGSIHLSSSWMISDKKRVVRIVDGGVGEVPRRSCV